VKHRDTRTIEWAMWSRRRILLTALAYGVIVGGACGVTSALVDHDSTGDAAQVVAFYVVVWCVAATVILFGTRFLARHPRSRNRRS
jgi:hypothetical protein